MPWVLRDGVKTDSDQWMDRKAAGAMLASLEERDPGIFLENLVPSRKKAQRVDLRFAPCFLLFPSAGAQGFSWAPHAGADAGRMAFPTLFIRARLADKALACMASDYRFDTAKANAGIDVMTSDTFVAAFAKVRWDYRKKSKEFREKALIHNDQNDRLNFRRVYALWLESVQEQGKRLFYRNYDLYENVMIKYFDLPDGVERVPKKK